MKINKSKKSFTLIELLVVVAIIGILAAMILPALASAREKAKHATCKNTLKGIGTTVATYFTDGTYTLYPADIGSASGLGLKLDETDVWTGKDVQAAIPASGGAVAVRAYAEMQLSEDLIDCPVKARQDDVSKYRCKIPNNTVYTARVDRVLVSDTEPTTAAPAATRSSSEQDLYPHNETPDSYSVFEDGHVAITP
jgi:prepilin-type N-terminal cleavage/methylation domain-containing protein